MRARGRTPPVLPDWTKTERASRADLALGSRPEQAYGLLQVRTALMAKASVTYAHVALPREPVVNNGNVPPSNQRSASLTVPTDGWACRREPLTAVPR